MNHRSSTFICRSPLSACSTKAVTTFHSTRAGAGQQQRQRRRRQAGRRTHVDRLPGRSVGRRARAMPPSRAVLAVTGVFLLLAVAAPRAAAAAQMTAVDPGSWASEDHGGGAACTGAAVEEEPTSRTRRREVGGGDGWYISYDAMSRGRVPCNVRGASYYNCRPGEPANPYSRGCSAITRCRS